MEIDIQSRYIAPVIAEERIRDTKKEHINLERNLNIGHLLGNFVKLFR